VCNISLQKVTQYYKMLEILLLLIYRLKDKAGFAEILSFAKEAV